MKFLTSIPLDARVTAQIARRCLGEPSFGFTEIRRPRKIVQKRRNVDFTPTLDPTIFNPGILKFRVKLQSQASSRESIAGSPDWGGIASHRRMLFLHISDAPYCTARRVVIGESSRAKPFEKSAPTGRHGRIRAKPSPSQLPCLPPRHWLGGSGQRTVASHEKSKHS